MEELTLTILYYMAALLVAGGVFAALYLMKDKPLFKKINNRQLAALVLGVS